LAEVCVNGDISVIEYVCFCASGYEVTLVISVFVAGKVVSTVDINP
jgi:hypothetical protein